MNAWSSGGSSPVAWDSNLGCGGGGILVGLEVARPPACPSARPLPTRLPNLGKIHENHQNVMNQVQVAPFGLILRQDGATASRNPLECLPAPKTAKKLKNAYGPLGPLAPPHCGAVPRCGSPQGLYMLV